MARFAIALHGGAGTLIKGNMTPDKEKAYKKVLSEALQKGYTVLENDGAAVDAVQEAVMCMEDSALFNAGKGSVFSANGTHEMEAAIMEGKTRKAGAVALLTGIKNPISVARDVMEKSQHVFLLGQGALEFAKSMDHVLQDSKYFYDEFRYQQWQEIKGSSQFQLDHSKSKNSKFGTVGAVACDRRSNLAAATSTGGMTNKMIGRLGDSAVPGAGNYANNKTCAVSCTGSGEYFLRGVVAYDVSCLMEMKNMTLQEAAEEVIQRRILEIGGDGGLIAVDAEANISLPFNTEGMYRAFQTSDGVAGVKIYKD
ncbi:beta-aspartyl-peptidase (threonine type) [Salegentibacter echinorum]|uniref:Isoaspartyl peptidase n=1 Tax=Salegentibacter echinorum TaxID=1073325 RepID=A0A1M5C7H1_SALEC|nr:isoaspartyl peptidase/L-asparaginase [Salegentibacter echinorum]SHF50362.1 beta-aspartyl-peptidase (threonine type) [Salegentibacter echinorum]